MSSAASSFCVLHIQTWGSALMKVSALALTRMGICQTASFANKILKFVVFMELMHFIFPQGAVLVFTLLDIAFLPGIF